MSLNEVALEMIKEHYVKTGRGSFEMTPARRKMAIIPEMLSTLMTMVVMGCIIGGVFKLFQIATDLREMKDLLRDIKRNSSDALQPVAAPPPQVDSTESLMRAVHGDSYTSVNREA